MQCFVKCINASLIMRQNGETKTTTATRCSSTVRKKCLDSVWMLGGSIGGEKAPKNSPKFGGKKITKKSFFAIFHSCRVSPRLWSFMVWQRTKPFKNSFWLHKKKNPPKRERRWIFREIFTCGAVARNWEDSWVKFDVRWSDFGAWFEHKNSDLKLPFSKSFAITTAQSPKLCCSLPCPFPPKQSAILIMPLKCKIVSGKRLSRDCLVYFLIFSFSSWFAQRLECHSNKKSPRGERLCGMMSNAKETRRTERNMNFCLFAFLSIKTIFGDFYRRFSKIL